MYKEDLREIMRALKKNDHVPVELVMVNVLEQLERHSRGFLVGGLAVYPPRLIGLPTTQDRKRERLLEREFEMEREIYAGKGAER